MANELTQQLASLGFGIVDTGGGGTAWRIDLPRSGYMLITDAHGESHEFGSDPMIGVYTDDDEPVVVSPSV